MPQQIHHRRGRRGLKVAVGVAAAAFALAVPVEVSRLLLGALLVVMLVTAIVGHRMMRADGFSSGLRPYIYFAGVVLVVILVKLLLE